MRFPIMGVTLALAFITRVHSKAIFAHYMVGNVTEAHAHQDIDDAMNIGIDGFALNIGDATQDFVGITLGYLFGYAAYVEFNLYISMDVYASGAACYSSQTSCNGPTDYYDIFNSYLGSSAYYLGPNGFPMISTFSSGGFENDTWIAWKETLANQMYFIPDFDETAGYYEGADAWYDYWGDMVDGVFSWESAWPERAGYGGLYPGDVSPDVTVIAAAKAKDKGYMMGLSTLQYKDSYGTNVYRAGDDNLPRRMENILSMSTQPDFIQILTWNDGPESHYIGNVWPEQNTDTQPAAYMNNDEWSHKGWQDLVASFITTWKAGGTIADMRPSSTDPVGALWYKKIFQDATCANENDGPLFYEKPDGFDSGTDTLNWAVVVPENAVGWVMTVYIILEVGSDDVVITQELRDLKELVAGLNYGSVTNTVAGGARLQIRDSDDNVVVATPAGRCISDGCPDAIYNMNYQVLGVGTDDLDSYQCISNSEPVFQRLAFYGITSEATCKYADETKYTGAEIWEGSNAGPYLEAVLDKMYKDQGNYENLDSYFMNYINKVTDGSYTGTCADFTASSGCGTTEACSKFDTPEHFYILRAFSNLQSQLKEWQSLLTVDTLIASLSIDDIVSTFGEALLKPLGDEAEIATIFGAIGTAFGVVSPTLGIFPETAEVGGVLGVTGALSAVVGTAPADTVSEGEDDMRVILNDRLQACLSQYYDGPAAIAHAIWTTGDVSSFPDWAFQNDDQSNDIARFFSGGAFSVSTDSYEKYTSSSLAKVLNHALIGYALKSANVYVLIGAHTEDTCEFSASIWQDDTCYGLEYPGPGSIDSTVLSDISDYTTRMPNAVIDGFSDKGIDPTDIINNAVACQKAQNAYDGEPTLGEDPSDYDPYPSCLFSLPVITVGDFGKKNNAWEHSPCKVRYENEDNDDSLGVGKYLPDNLASVFTKHWCFGGCGVTSCSVERRLDLTNSSTIDDSASASLTPAPSSPSYVDSASIASSESTSIREARLGRTKRREQARQMV